MSAAKSLMLAAMGDMSLSVGVATVQILTPDFNPESYRASQITAAERSIDHAIVLLQFDSMQPETGPTTMRPGNGLPEVNSNVEHIKS